MDAFSTEQGIWLDFVKTLEFQGGLNPPPPSTPLFWTACFWAVCQGWKFDNHKTEVLVHYL
jgi:hypothetical protein